MSAENRRDLGASAPAGIGLRAGAPPGWRDLAEDMAQAPKKAVSLHLGGGGARRLRAAGRPSVFAEVLFDPHSSDHVHREPRSDAISMPGLTVIDPSRRYPPGGRRHP